MLGTAWVDEAAYLRPPLSRLQAALSSNVARSSEDPSCRKRLRWQLEEGQVDDTEQVPWEDELYSTWVDELAYAAAS